MSSPASTSDSMIMLTILGGCLTIVLGVATFFLKRWIELVDETLKEHNSVIYKVSSQVGSLESLQSRTSEDITQAIQSEGRAARAAITGLPEIKKDIELIKNVMQTKILPHVDGVKNQLGKIIVIEKNQDEQGKLITKLYEALKLVIEKSSRPK